MTKTATSTTTTDALEAYTETMPKLRRIAPGYYQSSHYRITRPEGSEFWLLLVRYANGAEDWAQNFVTKREAVDAAEWCWTNDRHDYDAKN